MRRTTAALLLALCVFTATPTFAATRDDRDFFTRMRHLVARVLGHMTSNGDYLSPPKP